MKHQKWQKIILEIHIDFPFIRVISIAEFKEIMGNITNSPSTFLLPSIPYLFFGHNLRVGFC